MRLISACVFLTLASAGAALKPVPEDREWLRSLIGRDGALAYSAGGEIFIVEVSTGATELVGRGQNVEFSPDSSKLAWIDGSTAKGRMRAAKSQIQTIATEVEPEAGVHWMSEDSVALLLRNSRTGKPLGWHQVRLTGEMEPIPELDRLMGGRVERETDVKQAGDGEWSYVAGRRWRTEAGGEGPVGGGCSVSLSPDGRTITALQGGHRECRLQMIREGGMTGNVAWKYAGSFDNHRFSSNYPRLLVCVEEERRHMVVLDLKTERATRLGENHRGKAGEMYGDFTAGDSAGTPWPRRKSDSALAEARGGEGAGPTPEVSHQPVELGSVWPGTEQGLVFLWDHLEARNEVPYGEKTIVFSGRLKGRAIPNRHGGLDLARGSFVCEPAAADWLLAACQASNAFSVDFTFRTDDVDQEGPARIVTFSDGTSRRNFTIGQEEEQLVLRLRTSKVKGGGNGPEFQFGEIESKRWYHFIVAVREGEVAAYLDGQRVFRDRNDHGDLSSWEPMGLLFGDEAGGKRDWSGSLDGIAIYNRFIAEDEAEARAELAAPRRNREPLPLLIVEARLLEATPAPPLEAMDSYHRALTEHLYEVIEVREGTLEARRISVARWALLDLTPVLKTPGVGATEVLRLEPREAHPEMEPERLFSDVFDPDAPAFVEVR